MLEHPMLRRRIIGILLIICTSCSTQAVVSLPVDVSAIEATLPNEIVGTIHWKITPTIAHSFGGNCFYEYKEQRTDNTGRSLPSYEKSSVQSYVVAIDDDGCKSGVSPTVRILGVSFQEFEKFEGPLKLLIRGNFETAAGQDLGIISAINAAGTIMTIAPEEGAPLYRISFFRQGFFYSFAAQITSNTQKFKVTDVERWQ